MYGAGHKTLALCEAAMSLRPACWRTTWCVQWYTGASVHPRVLCRPYVRMSDLSVLCASYLHVLLCLPCAGHKTPAFRVATMRSRPGYYSSRDSRTPRKKYVRQAQDETDESASEEEVKEVNESSDSDGSHVADFAVAFHTIETHCDDCDSSSSDDHPKPTTSRNVTDKSATTKAKRI